MLTQRRCSVAQARVSCSSLKVEAQPNSDVEFPQQRHPLSRQTRPPISIKPIETSTQSMIVWKLFSKLPFHAGVHIRPTVALFSRRYSSDSFFSRHFIRIFSRLRLKMSSQGERMVETPEPNANGITETKQEVVDNDKKQREIPDKYRIKPDLRLVWIDCEVF